MDRIAAIFSDHYGQVCSLQQDVPGGVTINIDMDANGRPIPFRIGLDQYQARQLVDMLNRFIYTGNIDDAH